MSNASLVSKIALLPTEAKNETIGLIKTGGEFKILEAPTFKQVAGLEHTHDGHDTPSTWVGPSRARCSSLPNWAVMDMIRM